MKRIILCCDGTWNSADQASNGVPCPTNVVRLAYRIAKNDGSIHQIVYYGQGVGTGNSIDRITGGAFGKGVEDNIFDAYRFLIANYQPGDEIYLFGFSRGAFTARSIGGMIRKCGILKREHIEKYMQAVDLYRSDDAPDKEIPSGFRKQFSVNKDQPTPIRLVGVWDTVGSLGIPLRGLRRLTRRKHQFHDTELSGSVVFAFHALAVDELRSPFQPTLWQYIPKVGQTVEQAWFPGVHSNVGGGYPDRALADVALEWMIEKAKTAGLAFDDTINSFHPCNPDCFGKLYNSKKGMYRVTPGHNRVIGRSIIQKRDGTSADDGMDPTQIIHQSVFDRWDNDPAYRPKSLIEYFKRTNNERTV